LEAGPSVSFRSLYVCNTEATDLIEPRLYTLTMDFCFVFFPLRETHTAESLFTYVYAMRVWNLSTLFFIFIFGFCFGHFGVFFSQCLKKKPATGVYIIRCIGKEKPFDCGERERDMDNTHRFFLWGGSEILFFVVPL
jgi:hypothetical protein